MSLNLSFYSHTSLTPHRNIGFCLRNYEHRVRCRRRLKKSHRKIAFTARCQLGNSSPFDNFVQNMSSSLNSSELIAPVLGLASGLALYFSRPKLKRRNLSDSQLTDVGEWILFTTPTPFNRFVMLRCPSISFEDEMLGFVNEKLVKEDRHFVRLNTGRIQVADSHLEEENMVVYQRMCVTTDDGGVISMDWPVNLELSEEHGLDTTILLIPGTAEGSMEKNVQLFVSDCLKRGCFPIVMNPRGCSGSPLTTARLFTAADSDDISTAILFINNERPWTTLMGVGWGYGANMLTKYLAEVGDRTPLTAATCIDNPFDLEEATRSLPYDCAVDEKLTRGLVDILKSNKELFQGRGKKFDIESALQATSVRDFEKAVSMISYGFEAIEDFYANSSTQGVVDKVKIPLLFIQNDDGTVPLFSIPRSSIAENPFTSLLLCSCPSSSISASGRSTISWCQHLTLEWLSAVELGLLKGRHPLLKDVDVHINPSKDLLTMEGRAPDKGSQVNKNQNLPRINNVNGHSLNHVKDVDVHINPSKDLLTTEGRAPDKGGQVNKIQNLPRINNVNGHSLNHVKEIFGGSDIVDALHSRTGRYSEKNPKDEYAGLEQEKNDLLNQATFVGADIVKEDEVMPVDSERGEVLQTAEVVMNMLDVTIPDTLTEEQKKKVLDAVGRGETLMKALQDAVPEDVRGKLTTAVSGILDSQRSNLKIDKLLNIGRISELSSARDSERQGEFGGVSNAEGKVDEYHSSKQKKIVGDLAAASDENQPVMDKPPGGINLDLEATSNNKKSIDTDQMQKSDSGADLSVSGKKVTNELGEFLNAKDAQCHGQKVNSIGTPETSFSSGSSVSAEDRSVDQFKSDPSSEHYQSDMKEDNSDQRNEEKDAHPSSDQNETISDVKINETPSGFSLEVESIEKEDAGNQTNEEKVLHPAPNSSSAPTFSVSQALDALTGIDDSTQTAVNSVFNVIEDMITHLEEERDDKTKVEKVNESVDKETGSGSDNNQNSNDNLRQLQHTQPDLSLRSYKSSDVPLCDNMNSNDYQMSNLVEEPKHVPDIFDGTSNHRSQEINSGGQVGKEEGMNAHTVGTKTSAKFSNKVGSVEKVPHDFPRSIAKTPFVDPLYKEHLRKYLISKMENTKSLDLDTTTALFLDYFPEEGQWKLLEQTGHNKDSLDDSTTREGIDSNLMAHASLDEETDDIIEPSYVVLDSEKLQEPIEEYEIATTMNEVAEICDATSKELMVNVKNVVLDSLLVEVGRRLSSSDIEEMKPNLVSELEHVSHAASLALRHGKDIIPNIEGEDYTSEEVNTLLGEHIVRAVSVAVQETSYLRKVLPVGVVVGSSLAALRNYFDLVAANTNCQSDIVTDEIDVSVVRNRVKAIQGETVGKPSDKIDTKELQKPVNGNVERDKSSDANNGSVMVGAVSAAIGASALFVHQQDKDNEIPGTSSNFLKKEERHRKLDILAQETSEKNESNIVTSLAEKAMTVAGPVVPTKDGEVDQERLVAMLAEVGQKGGMLRLVGKAALLWGGIRGAMSLTDRLISFLRLAERPLFQRILGFAFMVLVLWAPIAVPLLPTILQSWAAHSSAKIAELACIVGLYVSIMTLITIWGKRVRGYENPLEQYGLHLTSSQSIQNFFYGLVGGVVLVLSIHSISALIGYVHLSWPLNISTASDALTQLKVYGRALLLCGQCLVTATGVGLVEELLFRSWLPYEVAIDFGYHRGIIISGLAFSLSQRSPLAIPGLWLLSLCLSGARQKCQGSLFFPIGVRTGIMASSTILKVGGFLTYQPNFPLWLTGIHSFQPFSGIVGLAFTLLLTIVLYPRQQPIPEKKI